MVRRLRGRHSCSGLKRELWARLLVAAVGTNFEATDDLFVTHTWVAAQEGPFRLDDAGQRVERDATFQRVSYDVAVWVGAAPRSDQEARNGFERRLPFLDDYTPQVHPALERLDRLSEQPHELLLNSAGIHS